jgi:hypothetical protein
MSFSPVGFLLGSPANLKGGASPGKRAGMGPPRLARRQGRTGVRRPLFELQPGIALVANGNRR